MAIKIIWSVNGLKSLENIIDYLLLNFSDKVADKFLASVENKLKLAQSNPMIYRRSPRFQNVHVTVVTKKVLLVYRYHPKKDIIEVIIFWDGRRDPKQFEY